MLPWGNEVLDLWLSAHVAFAPRVRLRQSFSRTQRSQKTYYLFQCVQNFGTLCLLQEMIAEADRDGDGAVNAEDFYRVMRKRPGNALDDIDSDDE